MGSGSGATPAADASMEDILASIRRILTDDEVTAGTATPPSGASLPQDRTESEGVLVLDPTMMVAQPAENVAAEPPPVPAVPATTSQELVAPETAAATASSVDSLVRTLVAERGVQVHHGGPTIEDIVREELRPLLKAWLDANLPPIVERLVRAEIERVVGRAVP